MKRLKKGPALRLERFSRESRAIISAFKAAGINTRKRTCKPEWSIDNGKHLLSWNGQEWQIQPASQKLDNLMRKSLCHGEK